MRTAERRASVGTVQDKEEQIYASDVTTTVNGTSPERGCIGCSFLADQVAHPAHPNARDTTLAFVSRAPQVEVQNLKQRMGWDLIPWYSLTDDFDADFGVGEWHGTNAFIGDGDSIFRTYLVASRGAKALGRPGVTSTSPRSDARRSGRTRLRAIHRRSPTVVELPRCVQVIEVRRSRRLGQCSGLTPEDRDRRQDPDHGTGE